MASLLDALPADLVMHVLACGSGRSTARAAASCTTLASLANTAVLWRDLCRNAGLPLPQNSFQQPSELGCGAWREHYVKGATCTHHFDWRRRDPSSPRVWLSPCRGAVHAALKCELCGREFNVEARAHYEESSAAEWGHSSEFADVRTTLRYTAKNEASDDAMDASWVEEHTDQEFCI